MSEYNLPANNSYTLESGHLKFSSKLQSVFLEENVLVPTHQRPKMFGTPSYLFFCLNSSLDFNLIVFDVCFKLAACQKYLAHCVQRIWFGTRNDGIRDKRVYI